MGLPGGITVEKLPLEQMTFDDVDAQNRWRFYIFGPYYKLLQGTLITVKSVNPLKTSPSKAKIQKLFGVFLLIAGLIPLFFRVGFLFSKMNVTTMFSLNWAINLFFALLAMHSIASLVTLHTLAGANFFNVFVERFVGIVKNKDPEKAPHLKTHVFLGIFMLFYIFAHMFYCLENTYDYDHFVTNVKNSSALYRDSMFGSQSLFFLDTAVIFWGAFVSALALALFNCVTSTLTTEYTNFNNDLSEAAKNGQLAHADLLNGYGTRQQQLIDLAHFAFAHFGLLVTISFIAGLVTHCLANFVMRSYAETIPGLLKVSAVTFILGSLFMLLADVKRVSDFAHAVDTTKNTILLERSIYAQNDQSAAVIGNSIILRIAHTHFLPTAFKSFKINEKFFQRAFLIFPFAIEFLHAHRRDLP
uniref:Gustatory receptor n=1 Tax=Panagrellus redivivus TaxID=6233 RepID=A0A7E4UTA8_PANRE